MTRRIGSSSKQTSLLTGVVSSCPFSPFPHLYRGPYPYPYPYPSPCRDIDPDSDSYSDSSLYLSFDPHSHSSPSVVYSVDDHLDHARRRGGHERKKKHPLWFVRLGHDRDDDRLDDLGSVMTCRRSSQGGSLCGGVVVLECWCARVNWSCVVG